MLLFSITVSSSFILITSSIILSSHKLSIISLHLLNVNYLFNSHEWQTEFLCTISIQYQPDFISDENKEEYQFGDNKLIQY